MRWSGSVLGPDDGFPGSLFGTGHDWTQQVSEISIPVPVIGGDLDALNTAETLQPFADIRGDLFDFSSFELPRAGLEYLGDEGDRLHFAWGQHYEDAGPVYTHGSAGVDLDATPRNRHSLDELPYRSGAIGSLDPAEPAGDDRQSG